MKRLKNALEDLDETSKVSDMAERLRRLEMIINKDIENFKTQQKNQDQTLRVLTDWISYLRNDNSYLRNDNELHKFHIADLLVAFAMDHDVELDRFLEVIERDYGLTYKEGRFVGVEHAHTETAKPKGQISSRKQQ